jgi:hypothetical protein
MPLLLEKLAMLLDNLADFTEFVASEAARIGERDGPEPEFGVAFGLIHVDVWRLPVLSAPEEEPVPADAEQGRHMETYRTMIPGDSSHR